MPADYRDSMKKQKDFCCNVTVNISHEMTLKGINIKDLAQKSGINEQTLRARFRDPGTMRLFEITAIAKVLGASPYKLSGSRLTYSEEV